jgi:uncharacterized protein (TIGR03067 family)
VWVAVSLEKNGESMMEKMPAKYKFIITADRMFSATGENIHTTAPLTYKLDPSKKPKQIDIIPLAGDRKAAARRWIYSLEGDTLIFSSAEDSSQRPTTFTGKSGSGQSLTILRRESPKVPPVLDAAAQAQIQQVNHQILQEAATAVIQTEEQLNRVQAQLKQTREAVQVLEATLARHQQDLKVIRDRLVELQKLTPAVEKRPELPK